MKTYKVRLKQWRRWLDKTDKDGVIPPAYFRRIHKKKFWYRY